MHVAEGTRVISGVRKIDYPVDSCERSIRGLLQSASNAASFVLLTALLLERDGQSGTILE